MSDAEWARDFVSGDYVCSNGRPVMAKTQPGSTLGPPVFLRMRCHRKGWLHAPAQTYGSDFHQYNRRRSVETIDQLAENLTLQCLAPMTAQDGDGRIDNLEVETGATQRGGLALAIHYTDMQNRQQEILTTPVGT